MIVRARDFAIVLCASMHAAMRACARLRNTIDELHLW